MAKVAVLDASSDCNPQSLREAADPRPRPSKLSNTSGLPTEAGTTGHGKPSPSGEKQGTSKGKRSVMSPATALPPASCSSPSHSKQKGLRWSDWLRLICQKICENRGFLLFGTLVTVWALIGDDLRLGCTDKPADDVFNVLVIFCIVFFSLEIFLCCMGQDDYFMGFFFGLDLISTATLVLDLSVVADALSGGSDGGADDARASRTARLGAKVGRVVRVLRLIRIVKLYKAFYTGTTKKLKRGLTMAGDETDLDEDDDFDAKERPHLKESLVGKKLSAKTTQRTILMVLTMLIVLPLLTVSASLQTPTSATMGADDIWQAFNKLLFANASTAPVLRAAYEEVLLKYVYYHNWFSPDECPIEDAGCSKWYYSQNFWVGVAGDVDLQTLTTKAESARLSGAKVRQFQDRARTQNDLYNYGTMPDRVLEILESPWATECSVSGVRHLGFSVLAKSIPDVVDHVVRCPDDVRRNERSKYTPRLLTRGQFNQWHLAFFFDLRPFTRQEAALSIITTFFVCLVLCVASLFFSNDANTLVLQPVEQMITKVEAIRDNPLIAMKMADEEFRVVKMKSEMNPAAERWNLEGIKRMCGFRRGKQELMETVVLEKTIIKLGSLLALGFGEAGANIVSHNMRGASSAGVNAMVEGTRVDCILGTARLRDFSTFTVVLQGAVMTFVNQVAEIVHGIVDEHQGAVNKNNGDTFLIIWRCADRERDEVTKLAEMSLMAFSTILASVHRSPVLANYRSHPGLQQRLSHCRVNLSFGLHYGWAIEGAVGSEFKIDASYLSQNVNIAASLEHATRVYNVSLIASEYLVELCNWGMYSYMRLIDKVIIKGSKDPMGIYSLDLDYHSLEVDVLGWTAGGCCQPLVWNSHQRYRARQMLEADKERLWEHSFNSEDVFIGNTDMEVMRRMYTDDFRHVFNMGYQNYSQGEWSVARQLLLRAQDMLGAKDGPSCALLQFMEVPHQFVAPEGWKGEHSLVLQSS